MPDIAIVNNGITITISHPVGNTVGVHYGTYADGTYWVVGSCTVTATSPAYTVVNVASLPGWMMYGYEGVGGWPTGPNTRMMNVYRKNPAYPRSAIPCVFDSDNMSSSLRTVFCPPPASIGQALPLALAPGDIFVASKSTPGGTVVRTGSVIGQNVSCTETVNLLRCVSTAPASGAFRPGYFKPRWPYATDTVSIVDAGGSPANQIADCHADIPEFNLNNIDLSLLPNLARVGPGLTTAAPTRDFWLDYLRQPCFYTRVGTSADFTASTGTPRLHARDSTYAQGGWPRAYGAACLAMCCDYPAAEKLDIASRVVQWGIDAYYLMKARWAAMETGVGADQTIGGIPAFQYLVSGPMAGDWWKGHGLLPFIVWAGNLLRANGDPGLKIRTDLEAFIDAWPFYSFSERGNSFYIKTGGDADGSANAADLAPTYDPGDTGATQFFDGSRYAGFQTAAYSTRTAYVSGSTSVTSSYTPTGPVIDNTKTYTQSDGMTSSTGKKLYGTRNDSGWWPEACVYGQTPPYTVAGGAALGNPQPNGTPLDSACFRPTHFSGGSAGPYQQQTYRGYVNSCNDAWVLAFRFMDLEGAMDGAIPTSVLDYMDRHITTYRLMAAGGSDATTDGDSAQLWGGGEAHVVSHDPTQIRNWVREMWDTYRRGAPYAGSQPPDDPPDPPAPTDSYAYLNSALGVSEAPIGSGIRWNNATNVGTVAGSTGIAGKGRLIQGTGDHIVISDAPLPSSSPVSFVWIGKLMPPGGTITPYTCLWQKATDIGLNHMFASLEIVPGTAPNMHFRFRLRTQNETPQTGGISGLYQITNTETAIAVNTLYRVTCSYDVLGGLMHLHVSSGTSTHTTYSGTCQSSLYQATAPMWIGIAAPSNGSAPGAGYPSQTRHEVYEFQARAFHTIYDLHKTEHVQMADAANFVLAPGATQVRTGNVNQHIAFAPSEGVNAAVGMPITVAPAAGIANSIAIIDMGGGASMPMSVGAVHISQGGQSIILGEYSLGGVLSAAVDMPIYVAPEFSITQPEGITLGTVSMPFTVGFQGLNRVNQITCNSVLMPMTAPVTGISQDGLVGPSIATMTMSVGSGFSLFQLPQHVDYTVTMQGRGSMHVVTDALLKKSKLEAFFGNLRRRRRKGRR